MSVTPTDPAVRALVDAVNAGDRTAFLDLLTPGATLSDDGTERDLQQWIDREIFHANGRMDVLSETDGGRSLTADFRNDTWGAMRTSWRFTVDDGGKIRRITTGQA
ncbi:nuclear transport factor 2 family protein [Streptomyces armeniacus]|uniref:Nuclear transport factor 2 family protein n=1 Tax=Streptomyces armeniacus TaxID=83291 RepID=A0A345XMF8_9ACTN|nr:nuclear transport factor 2 family protein [Streptomyces armeniacus]AXK32824.1 nuclear transport factor 2 family protein [Streptomyces armeniacus]